MSWIDFREVQLQPLRLQPQQPQHPMQRRLWGSSRSLERRVDFGQSFFFFGGGGGREVLLGGFGLTEQLMLMPSNDISLDR